MLNFRSTNIIFAGLLLLMVLMSRQIQVPALFYFLWMGAYLLILFYGCYCIASGFFMPVVCKAPNSLKRIAISFDDGPAEHTSAILKILSDYQVKATFFCIGKNIEQNAATLQKLYQAGHLIGNHSYSHTIAFDFWSKKKVQQDLQRTHELIKQITGRDVCWFRPPFGVINPSIARAVRGLNYTTIGWSIRSLDTVVKERDVLLKRVQIRLHPGAVILFHDICKVTVDLLPVFIAYTLNEGYEIVPMDKLLNLPAYADERFIQD